MSYEPVRVVGRQRGKGRVVGLDVDSDRKTKIRAAAEALERSAKFADVAKAPRPAAVRLTAPVWPLTLSTVLTMFAGSCTVGTLQSDLGCATDSWRSLDSDREDPYHALFDNNLVRLIA